LDAKRHRHSKTFSRNTVLKHQLLLQIKNYFFIVLGTLLKGGKVISKKWYKHQPDNKPVAKISQRKRFMYQFTLASLGLFMVSSISTHGAFFETGGAVSHAGYFVNPDDLKLNFEQLVANQDNGFLISLSSSTQNSLAQSANRSEDIEHVVKPGEDLSSIASWYGLKKVETVMWANNLNNAVIQPGMRLKVPAADGLRYTIRAGDTINDISSRFQVAAGDITNFNQINGGSLKEGQKLFIPNATVTSRTLIADNTPVQQVASNRVASPTIDIPQTAPNVQAVPTPTGTTINGAAAAPQQEKQPETTGPVVNAAAAPANSTPAVPAPQAAVQIQAAAAPQATTAGGWTYPVPGGCRITQGYHGGHLAVDCANRSGGQIIAASAGTIELSTCGRNGYGCHVIINHNNGFKSLYAHFREQPMVSVGQSVSAGQQLGWMGTTGWSTGVHLHFELVKGGVKISPIGPVF